MNCEIYRSESEKSIEIDTRLKDRDDDDMLNSLLKLQENSQIVEKTSLRFEG